MSSTMTMTADQTRDYQEDEHYVELENHIREMPPVVVFFSFLDQKSKQWALEHKIVDTIRRQVPMGTEVSRYHTSNPYSKELGQDVSHAWAVARSLQIDDKVLAPLFEAIQGETRATDLQGIKAAFDYVGIDPLRFDREYGKQNVKVELKWMDECYRRLNLKTLPAIVVGGRYLIKTEAFGDNLDANKVADVIKELLELRR